ncbi:MAG TPA: hypothetical protein PKA88_00705 [Polyangiaceae bacterium]|nr:hypothetical protein [Polyangiaceae bacterium]HMR79575.1 hypothetical protein [Polyangiaceae bacterium]
MLGRGLRIAAVLGLAAVPALADVPPPNECHEPGKTCQTAPPDFHSPGICKETKCSKPYPVETEWICNLCEAETGSRKAGGGGGCAGCAVANPPTPWGASGALALLGIAVATRRCRRRAR